MLKKSISLATFFALSCFAAHPATALNIYCPPPAGSSGGANVPSQEQSATTQWTLETASNPMSGVCTTNGATSVLSGACGGVTGPCFKTPQGIECYGPLRGGGYQTREQLRPMPAGGAHTQGQRVRLIARCTRRGATTIPRAH